MAITVSFIGFIGFWLLLWLPLALVVMRLRAIPWVYPVAADHKIPLLLPLYGVAPLAVWGYAHVFTGQTWADYGLVLNTAFWLHLLLGFAVATLGVSLLIAVELGLGWRQNHPHRPENTSLTKTVMVAAGVLVLTGFIGGVEELIFRGVLVQELLAVIPPWAMVLVASLVFAGSHLIWDGPAGVPSIPGLGLMGAVLILARWVDGGNLGLPWGLHSGWIFAIALVDTLNLFPPVASQKSWVAGLPDQPLTGLPALALLSLTGLGIWGYAQRF
jgi:membrane protease YdiL (CAAX protease family)